MCYMLLLGNSSLFLVYNSRLLLRVADNIFNLPELYVVHLVYLRAVKCPLVKRFSYCMVSVMRQS